MRGGRPDLASGSVGAVPTARAWAASHRPGVERCRELKRHGPAPRAGTLCLNQAAFEETWALRLAGPATDPGRGSPAVTKDVQVDLAHILESIDKIERSPWTARCAFCGIRWSTTPSSGTRRSSSRPRTAKRVRRCLRFDLAVVISNDSDLAWSILIVRRKFKKNIGIYKPERPARYPSTVARPDSKELQKNARWFRHIEERHLIASQLPPTLTDTTGTVTKPPTW